MICLYECWKYNSKSYLSEKPVKMRNVLLASVFIGTSVASLAIHGAQMNAFAASGSLKELTVKAPNKKTHRKDKASSSDQNDLMSQRYAPESVQIYVSLDEQYLRMYKGLELIMRSKISSGKKGHRTPTGVFSILDKRRHHKSNIYSNAPMPYMQRLTWSGIALHESNSVPRYPASHGCIRLPNGFAKKIFGATNYKDHVLIAPENMTPRAVDHPTLFQPFVELQASFKMRNTLSDLDLDYKTAPNGLRVNSNQPLRIYLTRQPRAEIVRNVQLGLKELGLYEDEVDGKTGSNTSKAVILFQKANELRPTGFIDRQVRVLVSEQTSRQLLGDGKIMVRQNHIPIYEADIDIERPHEALGSHFFVTHKYSSLDTKWIGTSISTSIPRSLQILHGIENAKGIRLRGGMQNALNRIKINPDVRKDIEKMLTPGTSISISDNGLGTETGKGTDFIVQTH